MTQLHDLSALEQAAALRAGEVSAAELVEHYERRCERLDAIVGAFARRTPELALEQARRAQALLDGARRRGGRGDGDGGDLPPLLGVCVPVKDLHAVAGVPMRAGSAVFAMVPDVDDHAVRRLREAGTLMTGKTSTPELGLPCYTEPDTGPPARTPWDLSRSAGGSSGGAAAAVAAGLAPLAHGSDGGGSVRIPASVCGLVGLKPSRGRVSGGPLGGGVGDLGVHGTLARTVADAAALLDAMSGAFPGDASVAPEPDEPFLASTTRLPGRLRVGRYRTPVIAETDLDAEVVQAYEEASALLAALGHDVEDVERPFGPEIAAEFEALWSVGALMAPVPAADEHRLRPLTRWLRECGRDVSGLRLAQANAVTRVRSRIALEASQPYDVVLTPALARLPAPVGGLRDDDNPAGDFAAQKAFTPFTSPYNLTGQPALVLPLHHTEQGLPVGVQLVGRAYGEAALLGLGAQLEAARPWRHRVPPLW